MKKSLTLATLATASAALPAFAGNGPAHAARDGRPNVIVILADDLGYGDLSCYGATRVSTPTVDSLARCGTRFTNAHACAATSTPSRYGLLTGEYPLRRRGTDVAAGNAGMIIPPERYTVADVFQAAGYHTAAFGKWHLGLGSRTAQQDWNGQLDQTPADLGFDYHYIMAATADRVPCVYIENGSVVPLIVCGTERVRRGHVSDALLSQVDLTATMAQLLGISLPAGAAPDSQPYLAAWMGRERKGRDWAFKTGHLHSHILRTQQWTYIAPKPGPAIIPWGPIIETGCSEGPQLYSVRRDVGQQNNVAEEQPRVVNQMQAILEALQLP